MARPVDPSVPQFALNSTIVPTKVLTDPQGLDQALQSGLQAVNGGYNFEAAQAAAAAGNGPSYPEAYQVNFRAFFRSGCLFLFKVVIAKPFKKFTQQNFYKVTLFQPVIFERG